MFIKALVMDFAGTDEEEDQQQQQQQSGHVGAGSSETAGPGAAGGSSNEEGGNDAGGSAPGDLAAGALKFANQMEAQQQQCGPADAEKVSGG
jgi:hypothetical protein